MDNPGLAQKYKNKTLVVFILGRLSLPMIFLQVTLSLPTWTLKSTGTTMESPGGAPFRKLLRDFKEAR